MDHSEQNHDSQSIPRPQLAESARAKIPKEFFTVSLPSTLWEIARSFLLWLIPPALGWWLYANYFSVFPWAVGVSLALLFLLSSFGLHRLGLVGHDGNHFSLHDNPQVSAYLGVFVSSFVPFHSDVGFAVYHADHHRFTNTEKDPDHVFFGQFKNWFSRLFLARIATSNRYFKATVRLAFNRWPVDQKISIGLKMPQLVRLARFNLVVSFALLIMYGGLTYFYPRVLLFMLWIPTVLLVLISGLRPYVEHAGTETDKLHNSRSWISPLFDYLFIGVNYHLAHHLNPAVPSYKLKAFHQWLHANGRLESDSEIHVAHNWRDFFRASKARMES